MSFYLDFILDITFFLAPIVTNELYYDLEWFK